MNDVSLSPGVSKGSPAHAVHAVYALRRYHSRSSNPLADYKYSRRVTRGQLAKLDPPRSGTKRNFGQMAEVDLNLMLNPGATAAIRAVLSTVDHEDFVPRGTRGVLSMFDTAYSVPAVIVQPVKAGGSCEVLTTVFCNNAEDLLLHSVFRVETPPAGGSP
jgi:hypothetical protein